MGFYRTFLTIMIFLFFQVDCGLSAGEENTCLNCHRPHDDGQTVCVSCHRGNDRTERKNIAHYDLVAGRFAHFTLRESPVVKRGEKLLEKMACRRCHRYADKGNRLAGNLDLPAAGGKVQEIFDAIKFPALFMPNFHPADEQIVALVNAILARSNSAGQTEGERVQTVHFQDAGNRRENVFVKNCGICHKILSEKAGGLGSGEIGPNLSGLLTGFYPRTYSDGEAWTAEKLKKWVDNPRVVRNNALMRPTRLAAEEFEQLLEMVAVTAALPVDGAADMPSPVGN